MSSYFNNPTWADIKPVPQIDEPLNVVNIAVTERFNEVLGYFRAILLKKEYSQRALDLTTDVIDLNSSNYSAWEYRRKCIEELGNIDIEKEMSFTREICAMSRKNYQVWHHRRYVLKKLLETFPELLEEELDEVRDYIIHDQKNYHTWSYRQWILRTYATKDIWMKELEFVDVLLKKDVRNNSAWNQRHFVYAFGLCDVFKSHVNIHKELMYCIHHIISANVPSLSEEEDTGDDTESDIYDKEYSEHFDDKSLSLAASKQSTRAVFMNESVWNYIGSLVRLPNFRSFKKLVFFILQTLSLKSRNRFALGLLVEIMTDPRCLVFQSDFFTSETILTSINLDLTTGKVTLTYPDIQEIDIDLESLTPYPPATGYERYCNLKRAAGYFNDLMMYDSIRLKYWAYRKEQILDLITFEQLPTHEETTTATE